MTSSAAQRFALIAQLAHDYNLSGRIAGKKALQKLLYAMQSRIKKANYYGFSFYNYGVYSSDLARDIVEAERYDFIDVTYDDWSNSYSIKPSANFNANQQFLPEFYDSKFGQDLFGRTAKELELITTIMFVCEEEKLTDPSEVTRRVHDLKPKFPIEEIEEYIPDFCSPAAKGN